MGKRCSKAITGALIFGASMTPAVASSINPGKVVAVYVTGAKALVDIAGSHTPPACAAASGNWAFDLTTPGGQAMYATAITAYSTKANVWVDGTGSCGDWIDRETISFIGLVP